MNRRIGACILAIALVLPVGYVGEPFLRAGDDLARGFADPPDDAGPWAYWWWLDSYATAEGITRDLEEMRRQGITGVLLFDAGMGQGSPVGPVFMSPAWRELFKHAMREAARLEIEVGVNLCSGWNAGGTWVTPEHAAKKLVYSEMHLQGPAELARELPRPPVTGGYYRDVAVLAFPARAGAETAQRLTASSSYKDYPLENATDGRADTRWISNGNKPGQGPTAARPESILWEFDEPFPATSLELIPFRDCGPRDCALEWSRDGKTFETICRFTVEKDQSKTVDFDETPARFFRMVIASAYPYGGSELSWNVQVSEVALLKKGQVPRWRRGLKHWELKSANRELRGYPVGAQYDEYPAVSGEEDCRSVEVLDLSGKVDPSGRLVWKVPEESWTVLRFGYTLLGSKTKCTSPGAQGYEIDFLSPEAMDLHFAATAERMLADAGHLVGKTLRYFHVDSYESGEPTWTPRFRKEFRARRGYDPLPYLPVLARRIADSREISNRFLWDYRRTIGDLFAESYYGRLRELSHRHGIGTHPESGGPFWPHIDALQCEGLNDIPMGEFWKRQKEPEGPIWWAGDYAICDTIKQAASAAHIYGKRFCQAEAFTCMGPNWEEDPFMLKDIGDRAFCAGLGRNVLCFYVHQPRLDIKPGYQWEAAGTHFDRNITWWSRIDAWITYLSRCQFLLQQGLFVADVCYFYGEGVPSFVPAKTHMRPPLPAGYDCDAINAEVLLQRMRVEKGRLMLPDGLGYRILVLPERQAMSPRVIRKIKELVEAGATVVGPRPGRAPGLEGYPQCDTEVKKMARELWGDGEASGERKVGRGRVIRGKTLKEILLAGGVPPDFEYSSDRKDTSLDYIHRTCAGAETHMDSNQGNRRRGAEIYFVSNQGNRPEAAECRFRVGGMHPEIWDPVTGARWDATDYRQVEGGTLVPLEFAPRQSWFVVFRKPAGERRSEGRNFPVLSTACELTGPWTVHFDPEWGGPEAIVFEKLEDWTKRPEEGIRYYSGAATYTKTFDLPVNLRGSGRRLYLDLGTIRNVAEVRLNEKGLGVVWTAPWRVDVTDAVRDRANALEIDVVNLWPNRLIGDAALPPERRLTVTNVKKFTRDSPLLESGLLGPVTLKEAR